LFLPLRVPAFVSTRTASGVHVWWMTGNTLGSCADMPAAGRSASLQIRLQSVDGIEDSKRAAWQLLVLRLKLDTFGDISQVQFQGGPTPCLTVEYLSAHSAARAKAEFGEACDLMESDLQSETDIDSLSLCTDQGTASTGSFDLCSGKLAHGAFKHVKLEHDANGQQAYVPSSKHGGAPVHSVPCFVHDLRLSQINWDDLANDREKRTALHLRGLPSKLCEVTTLTSLLQSKNLGEFVSGVQVLPSKSERIGCVIIHAASVEHVAKLAKFFHGRQFGNSPPVAVSFAPMPQVAATTCKDLPVKIKTQLEPTLSSGVPGRA